jgi:hypothetical protein
MAEHIIKKNHAKDSEKDSRKSDSNIKTSKADSEGDDKKDYSKKSLLYLVLIVIGILAILVVSYLVSKNINNTPLNDKRVVYNNFIFLKQADNTWSVDLSIKNAPYSIPFYYNPYEVDNISMHSEIIPAFKRFMNESPGGRVYIAVDPDDSSKVIIAGVEFARLLGDKYNVFNFDVVSAFSRPPNASLNLTRPVVSCRNANNHTMVIIMYIGNMTAIGYKNNCIVLEAANLNDTVKVADAFSYRLLGIIR